MSQRVLDVGNCGPDFSTMKRFLTANFDCVVEQAHTAEEVLEKMRAGDYSLVLVNRKLDHDYSDGIEILKLIKADPQLRDTPVMMITNYREHQEAATALGAELGFGKLEYNKPETLEKVGAFLNRNA